MKIALVGYGKMGKMIEGIALSRGHEIVSIIDIDNQQDFESDAFKNADVAIEFSMPKVAPANVRKCLDAGVAVVCGTTGWNDQLDDMKKYMESKNGTMFWTSNYSVGVNIFMAVNKYLAKIMNKFPEYDVKMSEVHHVHKLDWPSGTAITLAEGIVDNLDRKDKWVKGTLTAPDGQVSGNAECAPNELPVSSIREGEVPGIHTITYESGADTITINHDAKSRYGFALGAVLAAEYTKGRKGFLTMDGVFDF
ncbi:MAG: 4-hydroxy-tetrahydrodipicolinate reductase [Paludibacteraceae bacterium]|nr:4-hydroxy-tetrahydrodipicolinate reductase [Paludibacteraceae bacterium]